MLLALSIIIIVLLSLLVNRDPQHEVRAFLSLKDLTNVFYMEEEQCNLDFWRQRIRILSKYHWDLEL